MRTAIRCFVVVVLFAGATGRAQPSKLAERNAQRISYIEDAVADLRTIAQRHEREIINFDSPIAVAVFASIVGTMVTGVGALIRLGSSVHAHAAQIQTLIEDSGRRAKKLDSINNQLAQLSAAINGRGAGP